MRRAKGCKDRLGSAPTDVGTARALGSCWGQAPPGTFCSRTLLCLPAKQHLQAPLLPVLIGARPLSLAHLVCVPGSGAMGTMPGSTTQQFPGILTCSCCQGFLRGPHPALDPLPPGAPPCPDPTLSCTPILPRPPSLPGPPPCPVLSPSPDSHPPRTPSSPDPHPLHHVGLLFCSCPPHLCHPLYHPHFELKVCISECATLCF